MVDTKVPTADSASNTSTRDVIGNKSDTVAGDSLVALVKVADAAIDVIDGFHDVPSADAATNTNVRDVVGNKSSTVAGTDLIALAKRQLYGKGANTVLPADAAGVTVTAGNGGPGTWAEVNDGTGVPAVAFVIDEISISTPSAVDVYRVDIGTGAALSEVVIDTFVLEIASDAGGYHPIRRVPKVLVTASTRIAVRAWANGAGQTFKVHLSCSPM